MADYAIALAFAFADELATPRTRRAGTAVGYCVADVLQPLDMRR
ncbi:hypothetical protein ACFRDV_04875 [Streptomyces fagopyri]